MSVQLYWFLQNYFQEFKKVKSFSDKNLLSLKELLSDLIKKENVFIYIRIVRLVSTENNYVWTSKDKLMIQKIISFGF